MEMQLDFFIKEKSEMEILKENVEEVKEGYDKVRKSLFARHADLTRKYLELHERMQILEKNICQKENYGSDR